MSACEKAKHPDKALVLPVVMQWKCLEHGMITYSAASALAARASSQTRPGSSPGLQPNVIAYSALISLCEAGDGKVLLDEMQSKDSRQR